MSLCYDSPGFGYGKTDKDGTPNKVIEKGTLWNTEVRWHVYGDVGAESLDGTWTLRLKLESMGEGFEGQIKETTKAYTAVEAGSTPDDRKWKVVFNDLDTNFLKPDEEGSYTFICNITFKNNLNHPAAMGGTSLPLMLTFYKSAP